ncbi:VWA domain-containing protein [Idiomarina zobellii]|uniref:VWFA domain-containing protein n=1 Tax=Idiomarina zobellii TaxID=86103 RepID=A0A837NK84_9GAMM|nr:VWA domain-containing protein [Idiomarina zobellii]KPD24789.1 hypothetical protein AFK76_00020 [Idiomarina zobellii]SDF27060.1 VWA domain containing CoxE-like protein [Idiomarina zobellii]
MQLEPIILSVKQVTEAATSKINPNLPSSAFLLNQVEERGLIWRTRITHELKTQDPFMQEEFLAKKWAEDIKNGDVNPVKLSEAVKLFMSTATTLGNSISLSYWDQQATQFESANNNDTEELFTVSKLLDLEWQKLIDEARLQWQHEQLAIKRAKFTQDMFELINNVEIVTQHIQTLGFDPHIYFSPLATGELKPGDIELIKRWSSYLEDDDGIKRLCELLGRIRHDEARERLESVKVSHNVDIPTSNLNSKEEIIGIKLGNDIENAIPSELALLSDPDASLLFDLKLIESRLMCFDLQGAGFISEEREIIEEHLANEEKENGPFIICVDTSGSMTGEPEAVAKAVTLFIASTAEKQKRSCYLINFSNDIHYFDVGKGVGLESLIEFLKMSFNGGTDVTPAISHAIKVMSEEVYKDADLLVISDFIMGNIPKRLVSKIERLQQNGNQFYSLTIASIDKSEQLGALFDDEWVFDPYTSSVKELVKFKRELNSKTRSQANG